ncbi:MAG TPA: hypothetical protein VK742_21240 [Candidatus Sulfotelmatobacter sp.]|jgi:hypothetical protein|nr:hypothetical protein [Candidatus Sulfotelmatobacter sp.]
MNISIDEATWHERERSGIIINAGNEGMEAKGSQPAEALLMFIRGNIALVCIVALSLFAAFLCVWELALRCYKQTKRWVS